MSEPPDSPQAETSASETNAGESHLTWRLFGVVSAIAIFAVLLIAPLPSELADDGSQLLAPAARRLLAITAAMATLWFTEAIPVAATALIPLAAYPLLGIASAKETSGAYINHLTFLFFGGLVIAVAIEHWQVHRRIALRVMNVAGTSPRGLMLGLLAVSAGLSMWISNTATTMLLLPIGLALFDELDELMPGKSAKDKERLAVALLLAIAYGANCGGLATPVGTPTNAALLGFWPNSEALPGDGPSLGEWVVVAMPFSIVMLAVTAIVLGARLPRKTGEIDKSFLRERQERLGPPSGGAKTVMVVFVVTALLWVARGRIMAGDTLLWPGWQPALEAWMSIVLERDVTGMIHDSTVAMLASVILLILPGRRNDGTWTPLLDWPDVEKRVPWGVLLLFGSGFAIAASFESTGLADWTGVLAERFLSGASTIVVIAGAVALVTFLTELTTNVATISTLLPVLVASAVKLGIDPVLVAVPATLAASCAFMLPIATPPNAVVYGSGEVPLRRMIQSGVVLNIVSVILLTFFATTLLPAVLGAK